MPITLKQLRYFQALAETGNFSAAAEVVHISQPALSLQIKEMEAQLGTVLVERKAREIRLTRAGQEVLARSTTILRDVQDLEASVRLSRGLRGRLSLGVIPTIAPYLLPHVLTRLRASDMTLELRVREIQTARVVEALLAGDLDAAIIALPVDIHGLEALPLFDDRFLLAGSKARIEGYQSGKPPSPTDLPAGSLLLLDDGHCLADQALSVCGMRGRRQVVDLGASSLSTLCGLVGQGFGLTLLPELALRSERAAMPDMAVLRFPEPQPKRVIALVRRSTTDGDGWFTDLAELLREAGSSVVKGGVETA